MMNTRFELLNLSAGAGAERMARPVKADAPAKLNPSPARADNDYASQAQLPPPDVPGLAASATGERAAGATIGSAYQQVSLLPQAGMPLLPFDGEDPRAAEKYRILRANVTFSGRKPKVIAISSAAPRDGKTITSINLAGVLALSENVRVLLIDADLRRRQLGEVLGLNLKPGLMDVLRGHHTIEETILQVREHPNLHVLAAGGVCSNPAEFLDSPAFHRLVATCRQQFSFVVIDTTPMAVVVDFRLVQQVADGVVMVIRPDHTDRRALLQALEEVQAEKLLGVVLNQCEDWLFWKKQDYCQYYGTSPTEQPRRLRK